MTMVLGCSAQAAPGPPSAGAVSSRLVEVTPSAPGPRPAASDVEKVLASMSVSDKIGQLFMPVLYGATADTVSQENRARYGVATPAIIARSEYTTPAPLQFGHAPSEFALNRAGLTPFAFANALRIGSSMPVYVAGLLRRDPRMAPWSTVTTPSRPETEPWTSELFPDPATPVTTTSTPSGMSTSTSRRLCVSAPRTARVPVGVRTDGLSAAR